MMLQRTLREFLSQQKITDTVRNCNIRERNIPRWLIRELANFGVFGTNIDGYGCIKVDSTSYGIIMQELERCDSALRSIASVQSALVMYPIAMFGTKEQKQYWLPRLRTTRALGCFGLTEEYGGSNPSAIKTTAELKGGEYILNGSKTWITNGSIANVAVVWAKACGEIRGFLVQRNAEGFSTEPIKKKWSLRASATSMLFFDNCKIPKENILPGTDIGIRAALMCLTQARYGIAWGVIGAAAACYETALEYAKTRAPFGEPIASKQLIQRDLVEMSIAIENAKLRAQDMANKKDEGTLSHVEVSRAKLHNVQIACEVARKARNILGAMGLTYEMPVGAHLLNLETVKTYEGTEEIHTLIIGKDLTGFDAI